MNLDAMAHCTFTPADRQQMEAWGLTEDKVLEQLRLFAAPPPAIQLVRPCRLGDGIHVISPDKIPALLFFQAQAAAAGRFVKFVPASGAASRMFHSLCHYLHQPQVTREVVAHEAAQGKKEARDLITFLDNLEHFAFLPDLKGALQNRGFDLDHLLSCGRLQEILVYLLTEQGLNYQMAPKWRLKFHSYPDGNRTPLEEHLVEGIHYLKDQEGKCRFHFTISPAHKQDFELHLQNFRPKWETAYSCRLEVTYSFQKPATDTVAVDMANRPFRDQDGRLVFRPGGHGALLENLNDLQGDLIYIKNIDNIAPDRLKNPTILWKKVLGGFLVYVQAKIHDYLKKLTKALPDESLCEAVRDFAEQRLFLSCHPSWRHWPASKKRDFLVQWLNRPIRVCGVVPNAGEPGGGPFWVQDADGRVSLQIVEGAQVDTSNPCQQAIWFAATHFNPVDLVCGVRDYRGVPFHLPNFADPRAVFISEKFQNGRKLKALELPGLWNGAMAHWLTLFVEVPSDTFCPVKTVFDLLRPVHQ